ncbi:MAG: alpha-ketoacid dehydrogenase subunit beta [Candidatus Dormibacteraeota bacterium]|nr:alpha-ketoacid dehydrogenase subunit beta [Candidatus Dormibacteraeota bacterium]
MTVTMASALNTALRDALREDDSVVIYGEDVGRNGGVFRVTDGLQQEFGVDRCFDTPVAESGIAGTALGMALYGLRPVVEMQFDGFSYPALDQVISHVAKYRNRTRGAVGLPIVIRIPYGGGIGAVEHHSESPEAYYAHTAGLTVVSPGTPGDAYVLLRAAIDHPDPVVFLEPKRRYWQKEDVELPVNGEPIGRAIVRRSGTTATLIAYGPMVTTALETAEAASNDGWDLEVIDVRTLTPLDADTLVASVVKTGHAIVVHEAPRFAGYGAEIAATLGEQAFGHLAAPVLRVTGFDVPYPPAKIEGHYLPHVDRILDAVAHSLEY